jgi:hypothetical protein
MAGLDGYIGGNATSGIGQGLAFVLPEGKAGEYQMHLAQQHTAQLQAAAQYKRDQQQKLQEEYYKDLHDQKLPDYYAPFDKAINDANKSWLNDASTYFAKTGKNPFNDPEYINKYNTNVLGLAKQSKDLGDRYAKLMTEANTDREGKFTDESKANVLNYLDQIKSDPLSSLNKGIPSLELKPSTFDDLAKTVKPVTVETNNGAYITQVPNSSAHKAQAYANLEGDSKWNNVKTKYGINPDLGDIGGMYNPQGKRVWYTNPTATQHRAEFIVQNPTEPENAAILQKLNIDPTNSYAVPKLQDAIAKQNAGYGKLVTDLGRRIDAQVNTKTERTYAADNNSMAHQRLNIAEQQFAWEKQNKAGTDDGRDAFIADLGNGDTNARNEIIRAANAVGGRFSPSKDGFTITIPEESKVEVDDGQGNKKLVSQLKDKIYTIPKTRGAAQQASINALLNKIDLFKKRALYEKKDNPYSSNPLGIGMNSNTTTEPVDDDPLGLL